MPVICRSRRALAISCLSNGREQRDARNAGMEDGSQSEAIGAAEVFDLVVLAVGFGLEQDDAFSYWRNEQLGQPSLDHPRKPSLFRTRRWSDDRSSSANARIELDNTERCTWARIGGPTFWITT